MIISGKNTIYEQLINQKRKQPRLKGWKKRKWFSIDCGGVNVTQLATLFRMSACWFPSEQLKLSAESKTRTHIQRNANGDGWRKGMWHTVYVSSDITSHHPLDLSYLQQSIQTIPLSPPDPLKRHWSSWPQRSVTVFHKADSFFIGPPWEQTAQMCLTNTYNNKSRWLGVMPAK